jgi:hypothetical protein
MKNYILILAGAVLLSPTYLVADELGSRIDARVSAMKEARSTARSMAKNEARKASMRPVVSAPRPAVNTVVTPQMIKNIEVKPEVVQLKKTTTQTQNTIIITQKELQAVKDPIKKVELQKKLKVETEMLKADKGALKKKLVEEAKLEIAKTRKTRSTH